MALDRLLDLYLFEAPVVEAATGARERIMAARKWERYGRCEPYSYSLRTTYTAERINRAEIVFMFRGVSRLGTPLDKYKINYQESGEEKTLDNYKRGFSLQVAKRKAYAICGKR